MHLRAQVQKSTYNKRPELVLSQGRALGNDTAKIPGSDNLQFVFRLVRLHLLQLEDGSIFFVVDWPASHFVLKASGYLCFLCASLVRQVRLL